MKHKIKIVSLAIVFFFSSVLQAQEKRSLTLDEAIGLSLRNSGQLKMGKAKLEEATAALNEARESRLPDAGVSGSYLRLSSANVDLKSSQNNGGSSPKISQAMYGMVNLSLPIYTGGKIRYGIESSRLLVEAARLDAEQNREEVMLNTVEAYVNLYKAKAAVDLVNKSLEQSRQRLKDLSGLEKNGLLARNDLLKAELQASQTELSLLDAENNWQLANVNMNILLGLPEQTVLVLDSAFLTRNLSVANLDEYLQLAKGRKDLEATDLRKQAALTGIKAARSGYYPNLAITGGYIAANVPHVLTVTNAMNIGLGVSYNISSLWKTKSKVQGAEARARQMEIAQSLLSDEVKLRVNQSYLNLASAQKKIEVYQKAIEQATENYRITNNKYKNSLATTTELLDADIAVLQAQLNSVFSKADAVLAYHKLLQTAGVISSSIK